MISDLSIMITILLCGASILIIVFLSVLVKSRRTKDSCSGSITNGIQFIYPTSVIKRLINIEEEQKFASAAFQKLAKTIEFLPDLDA